MSVALCIYPVWTLANGKRRRRTLYQVLFSWKFQDGRGMLRDEGGEFSCWWRVCIVETVNLQITGIQHLGCPLSLRGLINSQLRTFGRQLTERRVGGCIKPMAVVSIRLKWWLGCWTFTDTLVVKGRQETYDLFSRWQKYSYNLRLDWVGFWTTCFWRLSLGIEVFLVTYWAGHQLYNKKQDYSSSYHRPDKSSWNCQ